MRSAPLYLSHLFTKTSKQSVSDASSKNADLLVRAGFIAKTMAGVYSYLPLGYRVIRHIEQIVREEMDAIGGQELLMSALSPKEYWQTTGRWDQKAMDVLFHVPAAGEQEYALNPTHEEVIVPLVRQYVSSYKDLPFSAYQMQTKFRNELRAKSGILRGREFLMKDLYSFHVDDADLDRFYHIVQQAYTRIFDRLHLAPLTYLTYASGGTFSQYSHEYQVVLASGEDSIFISTKAEESGQRIAINREIYQEGATVCPVTGGNEFREEKASEAANIFKLGTKFSDPFQCQYTDAAGALHSVVMGCYGIGISRLMGILTEAFADDAGLSWPIPVAPALCHIVPLAKSADDAVFVRALDFLRQCDERGIACIFDDRLHPSFGSRLADADLLGMPYRAVFSDKNTKDGTAELRHRASGDTLLLPPEECLATLANCIASMD